jgi:hypothetical protein
MSNRIPPFYIKISILIQSTQLYILNCCSFLYLMSSSFWCTFSTALRVNQIVIQDDSPIKRVQTNACMVVKEVAELERNFDNDIG